MNSGVLRQSKGSANLADRCPAVRCSTNHGFEMYLRSCFVAVALTAATAALLSCGASVNPEYAQWGEGQQAPPHMRVIWLEDPAHEMVVSWSTTDSQTNTVYYDTQPRDGDLEAYAHRVEANLNGTYEDAEPSYHHAFLTNLEPSTTYHFVVSSDERVSREFHVVTAPADDTPFKLMYGGDSRSNRTMRRQMNQSISEICAEDPGILAMVHGGDYVADGNDWEQWNEWLEDHRATTTVDGRVLPIIPTRGKHEAAGVLFDEVFAFPGGKHEDFYRTQLGSDVVWLTLDTNSSMAGEQRDWLVEQLEAAQAHRWVVASYHEPAYPAVKSSGPAKKLWVPLFERYNVDLACESDGHALKRTVPIRRDFRDPTGVVYVGEGGLGVGQRSPETDRWYLKAPGMAAARHHVQVLSFAPDGLTYEARSIDNEVIDTYTRQPRQRTSAESAQAQ